MVARERVSGSQTQTDFRRISHRLRVFLGLFARPKTENGLKHECFMFLDACFNPVDASTSTDPSIVKSVGEWFSPVGQCFTLSLCMVYA